MNMDKTHLTVWTSNTINTVITKFHPVKYIFFEEERRKNLLHNKENGDVRIFVVDVYHCN